MPANGKVTTYYSFLRALLMKAKMKAVKCICGHKTVQEMFGGLSGMTDTRLHIRY